MSFCPTCKRAFPGEGGFCPYDGVALSSDRLAANDFDAEGQTAVAPGDDSGDVSAEYDELIGTTLEDRYAIEAKIGEGGMGVVFRARHVVIEKPVAIKVLKREVAADDEVVKRFVQEARAASRIGHPNIIDVTDFGTTAEGITYQVMELFEGPTLADVLRAERTLPVPRALTIVAQLARALGAGHEKGIVHRDLKPENVFLVDRTDRGDFVKIVDFGIAKVAPGPGRPSAPRLTRLGSIFGTPEYMAPEQAAGRADVDGRADLYAVGVLLYEMLTGRVPHKGDSPVKTLSMVMLDAVAPPRQIAPGLAISAELEQVILRALAKKPADRFADMAALLAALEDVTTATELDLPRVVSQEIEAVDGRFAPPANGDALRTLAEVDGPAPLGKARQRRVAPTDPAFVASDARPAFDDLEPEYVASPGARRLGPWLAVSVVAIAGIAAALWALDGDQRDGAATAAISADAASRASAAPDAAAEPIAAARAGTPDAAADEPATAHNEAPRATERERERSRRSRRRKPPRSRPRRRGPEHEITIASRPKGARFFIDGEYAGSDGLHLRRPRGSKVTITCKLAKHENGHVELVFDGKADVALCRLEARSKCVEGLKGFDDECP